MAITTDRLLRGIKRKPSIVANNQLQEDSDFLEWADDSMRALIVPLLKSVGGNYLLTTPTQTSLVADQDTYDIPYRAVGRKLRNLKLSADGTGEDTVDLTLVDDDKIQNLSVEGTPQGFYYIGDQIVVRPRPTVATGYLELWWYLQPSRLVAVTDAARVSGIAGDTVTVTSVPSTMSAGCDCDFIQGRSGCRLLGMDKTITNVAGTQISFGTGVVPTGLVVGDYVALAQETPLLQMPDELHPLFEADIVARALQAVGDLDNESKVRSEMMGPAGLEARVKSLLEQRTDQASIKIVNRAGLLRGRGGFVGRLSF